MNQDIDKASLGDALKKASEAKRFFVPGTETAAAGCDFRARTPADMAEQLERDATSLEITGASFAKDEAFYKTVAANLREAAVKLATWQEVIDAERERHAHALQAARKGYIDSCITAATLIRNSVPDVPGAASTWRDAGNAIVNALVARRDSLPREAGR